MSKRLTIQRFHYVIMTQGGKMARLIDLYRKWKQNKNQKPEEASTLLAFRTLEVLEKEAGAIDAVELFGGHEEIVDAMLWGWNDLFSRAGV